MTPSTYHLPDGYTARTPEEYVEFDDGSIWQPDVYPLAAESARERGARWLIDIGCSDGRKLLPFGYEFDLIGIDLPGHMPDDPGARWIAHDLDADAPLPLDELDLEDAMLVCSDVIEHLVHPERLVRSFRDTLPHAKGLVLSTPDRERVREPGHNGPPQNPAHAREWAARELVAWLTDEGLTVESQTWQRSNDQSDFAGTIVLVIAGG